MPERNVSPWVLYVDDEPGNRLVFSETFSERFPIKTVESGAEALEVLAELEVGVLVTDQRMPGMSGNELLQRVRDRYPTVIRAVITAYADLDPILRAVNEGLVVRYLVKPWVRTEVEEMLAWALDAYRLGEEEPETQLRLLATERLVTLGSINAAIVHDIKQPLSYITLNARQLVTLGAAAPLGKLLQSGPDALTVAERAAIEQLAVEIPELAGDILTGCETIRGVASTVQRLIAPRENPPAVAADPGPSIRFALSACRRAAVGLREGLDYEGPEDFVPVAIGATELIQVLINLITNAIQAAKEGRPAGTHVIVDCRQENGRFFCRVKDDGPGMSTDLLEKVGKAFFSTRRDGTGLGLYQCRRLIEGAGGELEITSRVGEGTTVSFVLQPAGVSHG